MNFKLGELFCGPGGIAVGALASKVSTPSQDYTISHAWATDRDRDTCKTYITNICPDAPKTVIRRDIRTLKFDRLAAISNINALAFGFPCNDFSVVGKQSHFV